jgi:hypothetical protein
MPIFSSSVLHKASFRNMALGNTALSSMAVNGTVLALVVMGLVSSPAAHAQTVFETGDAGQTLSTAQSISTAGVSKIIGSLNNPSDADLYRLYISSPATFSASTINAVTDASGIDTELSLFDAAGHGLATNDDASGFTIDSNLPAGNALYRSLAPGYYYLGISASENEAINSASQLIFQGYPGGDTTAVRGAASGLNPTVLFNFNSNEYDTTSFGSYEIDLTGTSAPAAVPEVSTTVSLGLLLALGLSGILIAKKKASVVA